MHLNKKLTIKKKHRLEKDQQRPLFSPLPIAFAYFVQYFFSLRFLEDDKSITFQNGYKTNSFFSISRKQKLFESDCCF